MVGASDSSSPEDAADSSLSLTMRPLRFPGAFEAAGAEASDSSPLAALDTSPL